MSTDNTTQTEAVEQKPNVELALLPGHIRDTESGDQVYVRDTDGARFHLKEFRGDFKKNPTGNDILRFYVRQFNKEVPTGATPEVVAQTHLDAVQDFISKYGPKIALDMLNEKLHSLVRLKVKTKIPTCKDEAAANNMVINLAASKPHAIIFDADDADKYLPGEREITANYCINQWKTLNSEATELKNAGDMDGARDKIRQAGEWFLKANELFQKSAAEITD